MNYSGQAISKKRITDHGEVFTSDREVQGMLNLVQQETDRIESRFLEPACGRGNFLAPVLERKLAKVKKIYGKSQLEFERYSVIGIAAIYGVDIQKDNVRACRKRLFDIFDETYTKLFKYRCKDACRASVKFVLEKNILWGDALSLKIPSNKNEPIIFSEWSPVNGSMIKRRDYIFEELLPGNKADMNLFDSSIVSDSGKPVFIPMAKKEHPLMHFLELSHYATD